MALWLCKQEPSCYSFDDLLRDGSTVWDGIRNPMARIHLRQMKSGDRVFFYHTGKEKAVVGEMVVSADPKPDPKDETAVVVEVRPVRKLANPVTLTQIKADKSLAKWDLVRMSRLSVVPVTAAQWRRVEKMAESKS
jgi:predicted RNA-binding protein with PUA-like domain